MLGVWKLLSSGSFLAALIVVLLAAATNPDEANFAEHARRTLGFWPGAFLHTLWGQD